MVLIGPLKISIYPIIYLATGMRVFIIVTGSFASSKTLKTVTLCSPALPKFSTFHPETDLVIKHYGILGTGFGGDSRDGEYEIVRLLKPMKAEVFSRYYY